MTPAELAARIRRLNGLDECPEVDQAMILLMLGESDRIANWLDELERLRESERGKSHAIATLAGQVNGLRAELADAYHHRDRWKAAAKRWKRHARCKSEKNEQMKEALSEVRALADENDRLCTELAELRKERDGND